jgi:uncharacterized membrane protein
MSWIQVGILLAIAYFAYKKWGLGALWIIGGFIGYLIIAAIVPWFIALPLAIGAIYYFYNNRSQNQQQESRSRSEN